MRSILLFLHLAGVIIWVGGMFFAHFCLRPAAAAQLPPPQRLPLLAEVLGRFFFAVAASIVAIIVSGFAIIGSVGTSGGFGWVVAELLARLLGPALWWMVTCARVLGGWAWASIPVPDGVVGAAVVSGATLVVGLWARSRMSAHRFGPDEA